MSFRSTLLVLALFVGLTCTAYADASFDLSGPHMEVSVTRASKHLPISQVPSLQAGDRIWIHPAFPENESAHYVLIVAFLRGSTNPPPDKWFKRAETWNKSVRTEGIVVTVPEQAQQALLFLAPQNSGDFTTLRSAVQGKPGAFVRAAQDLNLASSDRLRLDKYLAAIRESSAKDPDALHEHSLLLARSLSIKQDSQCFDKPTEQQAPCLTQNTDQMVLDDGHGQSMLATLSNGPEVDLLDAVSATKPGGSGVYSPYIGVIVDMVRVLENVHTAQYQYIPALALPRNERLNLRLNNPPSFHKPKSVLVIALPPVKPVPVPSLRAVEPKQMYCVQKPSLVLAVQGAPVLFASDLAHDFKLHVQNKASKSVEVPLTLDASLGGFVMSQPFPSLADFGTDLSGTVRGVWGFQNFEGPTFSFKSSPNPAQWTLAPDEQSALVVGREDSLHLHSDAAVCMEEVSFKDEHQKPVKTSWKVAAPDSVELKLSLADAVPGGATLAVKQFGLQKAVEIPVRTYAEAGHIDKFSIHAGDQQGVLKGARLDQVASLEIDGTHFLPSGLKRVDKEDELSLSARDALTSAFQAAQKSTARVTLKDGRVLALPTTVEPQRPKLALLGKKIQTGHSSLRLGNSDELPLNGRITFFLKSETPSAFPRTEKLEIGSTDGAFRATLTLSDGSLSLQDSQTVIAVLDPLKSFNNSAFGMLQFRPIAEDGSVGDWQPLARLVRVPNLKEVHCPENPEQQCTLTGDQLYLIEFVSADRDFAHAASVPSGFADTTLSVPRPNGTLLYLKLRDDPSTISTAVLPVLPDSE